MVQFGSSGGDRERYYLTSMRSGAKVPKTSRLLQESLERDFKKHPEYCDALEKAWDLLATYRTPENSWLLDSLFQSSGEEKPERVDMAFSSELVFHLMRGRLYYLGIDVKQPPVEGPGGEILNEMTLSAIGAPFSVEFRKIGDQRHAVLTWDKQVTVHSHRAGGAHLAREIEPGWAFLQIGYARALSTGLALRENRRLARWPHGHTFMYLLYTDIKGMFKGITDPTRWLNDRI